MFAGLLLLASIITYHIEPRRRQPGRTRSVHARTAGVVQKVNRTDLNHLHRLPALVVPDTWLDDELAYSPMPRRFPRGAPYRRLVLVYQPAQVFGAYQYGTLVRWGPVSTGRRTEPTPSGLFYLNWRKRSHISTIDPEWLMNWAFNFDNRAGLAFHEQALPGAPASHGCVRLLRGRRAVAVRVGRPVDARPRRHPGAEARNAGPRDGGVRLRGDAAMAIARPARTTAGASFDVRSCHLQVSRSLTRAPSASVSGG